MYTENTRYYLYVFYLKCKIDENLSVLFSLLLFQGVPFPQNEANAMDVVIQFAVHKLGFQLTDIIVYAWSIGGFTGKQSQIRQKNDSLVLLQFLMSCSILASWAVMSYPEIRALVLDASFDDLLPLALKVMPESWSECLFSSSLLKSLKSDPNNSLMNVYFHFCRTLGHPYSEAVHEPEQC